MSEELKSRKGAGGEGRVMAEYIYAERVLSSKRYGDGVVESVVRPCGERREEVVRCRDCAHAIRLEGEPAEARPGMLNCVYFSQWDYYDDEPGVWLVEPDGFCAWGRRKEVSDDADR